MNRKLMLIAGVVLFVAAFVVMVRLADQSGYGKPAPPARSPWLVSGELPNTNSNAGK